MEGDEYYPSFKSDKADKAEGETSILPMSFFGGKEIKPGKRCQIEVVHTYGDEVEVRYVPHNEKKMDKMDEEQEGVDVLAESEAMA